MRMVKKMRGRREEWEGKRERDGYGDEERGREEERERKGEEEIERQSQKEGEGEGEGEGEEEGEVWRTMGADNRDAHDYLKRTGAGAGPTSHCQWTRPRRVRGTRAPRPLQGAPSSCCPRGSGCMCSGQQLPPMR